PPWFNTEVQSPYLITAVSVSHIPETRDRGLWSIVQEAHAHTHTHTHAHTHTHTHTHKHKERKTPLNYLILHFTFRFCDDKKKRKTTNPLISISGLVQVVSPSRANV